MQRSARSEIAPLPLTPLRAPADACRWAAEAAVAMNALPYFRLDIQTTLSVEEARRRLNGHLHPRRP